MAVRNGADVLAGGPYGLQEEDEAMTPDAVRSLKLGLYRLHWKDEGGSSLASVGVDSEGWHWFAPCNWIGFRGTYRRIVSDWQLVERAEPVRLLLEEADGEEPQRDDR